MEEGFRLRFDGLDARQHHLPMQQLGLALVGANRIMVAGLILAVHGRLPRPREKFDLQVVAEAPKKSSVEIFGILKQFPWLLPIIHDFVAKGGAELVSRFMSFVLAHLGGRKGEAQVQLEAFIEITRAHLKARNDSEQRLMGIVINLADRLVHPAQQAVAPVGRGATELLIGTTRQPRFFMIDEPMADVIRSKQADEVGDLQKMRLRVDGIIHHSRQLKVEHPQKAGQFMTAEVRDPSFENTPSLYSEAAANRYELEVQAKPVYRLSELHKLYIMDANKAQ